MYYDPMISKLITWDETRDKAMIMLGDAMDEYVIRGVTHNVGFGRSILRNNDFRSGNYSTAFIPTFYPKGFFGDPLSFEDHSHLAISAYFLKNKENQHAVLKGQDLPEESKTVYVSLHDISDTNYQITRLSDKEFEVKTLPSGESTKVNVDNFNVEYDALIRFGVNGQKKLLQFLDITDNLNFRFYIKGNTITAQVYDEKQYALKHLMAPPKKIDFAKSVISPMPGAIVSVNVEVGQVVADGQELLTIEAMKMQNMIKAQADGKIKKINVKPGQSVAVDQLLIEFE